MRPAFCLSDGVAGNAVSILGTTLLTDGVSCWECSKHIGHNTAVTVVHDCQCWGKEGGKLRGCSATHLVYALEDVS